MEGILIFSFHQLVIISIVSNLSLLSSLLVIVDVVVSGSPATCLPKLSLENPSVRSSLVAWWLFLHQIDPQVKFALRMD